MSEKFRNTLFSIGALCVLAGAITMVFHWSMSPYIFSIGAAAIAIARLTYRYQGDNFRIKKLQRVLVLSAFCLLGASYMIFRPGFDWVIFVLIAALLELYGAFVSDYERKKEEKR